MKRNEYTFKVDLKLDAPVKMHTFLLRCVPAESDVTSVMEESVTIDPPCRLSRSTDGFGNVCFTGLLEEAHAHFTYEAKGTVVVDFDRRMPVSRAEALRYRSTGSMTQPSGLLASVAAGLEPLLRELPPQEGMMLIMSALQARMTYRPGTTDTKTTAVEAFEKGCGVCQDFANIYIAMAHCLGYTARYCMGLASAEGSTHAWVEVLLSDGWHGIDPTRGCMTDEGYVRIAVGRDSADCPAECGVMHGKGCQVQIVETSVREQIILPEQMKPTQQQQQ